ncbi:MAG: hypothetical protein HN352_05855 [Bacteroidetes bacterium]|jgi:hypothetical protein|nr:hypothetical protein [Bacteroidota bacterium]MBT4410665.1 hypothetical protein [Bacteroidota bacterium]MBT6046685.1 hypothetical protein [Candidatus Scalindua sp.]MBT7464254.1 hypothetical protein [Bacteroidota bacterium]
MCNLAELHPGVGVSVGVLRSVGVGSADVLLFPQPMKMGFPIKIRITQNRKAHYINLKYYIPVNQKDRFWNSKKGELRKSFEHYLTYKYEEAFSYCDTNS